MKSILLTPPIAFGIYLMISYIVSRINVPASAKGSSLSGKQKAYACGENVDDCKVQPDYSEFFPFAFFFTLMHVAVLAIATVPSGVVILPVIYLTVSVVSIIVLFRR